MELLHFTTCLNTSSLINLSGHQRMQQGFCPMGRHLCQVAQTSTLKKNGWFSITVIFLWTYKKKKKYELSSSDFDFHISEVSLSGKKKKKWIKNQLYPICPGWGTSNHLHVPCSWHVPQCSLTKGYRSSFPRWALLAAVRPSASSP